MTTSFSLETNGPGGEPTPTALSAVISPAEFAAACHEIVKQHDGHAAHRELDRLVTGLLSSLGYGEGMAIFLAATSLFHPPDAIEKGQHHDS